MIVKELPVYMYVMNVCLHVHVCTCMSWLSITNY